ncbi:EAL domain-containing protein [uncultured Neptuniibacter sp.]|uniref:EAL domain-containing protein n=1 Tax=uncultured Neptuniibacter sp. TaxID=502143 RepID=UPI002611AF15|nr:EAL domain-containing protein [uncultured Neptuniibacter sp.]
MTSGIIFTLVNNVALLLAMGVLYDAFSFHQGRPSPVKKLLTGIFIGLIGISLMSVPLSLVSGVIIDARSILLFISGLFFGLIPTITAVVMTVGFRVVEGGQGVVAGILIILTSAAIGVGYRLWREKWRSEQRVHWSQLYLLGVVVHAVMLACLSVLPNSTVDSLLSVLALPLMLIFPLATVLLGRLITHQIERRETEDALIESECRSEIARKKLEATFAAIPDLLFEMDIDGRYLECHASDPNDLVLPREELIGKTVFDVMPSDAASVVIDALKEAWAAGVSRGHQIHLQLGYVEKTFELSVSRKASDEERLHFIVLSRDVTERKLAEKELHIAATAFDSQEGMLITDENHKILRVNNAFTRVTGYEPEEIIGKTPASLQSGHHNEEFYSKMMSVLAKERFWQGEIWNKRKSGEIYPQQLTITAVEAEAGRVTNYVGSFTDITQRKKSEEDIHKLAFYDPLTGLPNRRSLQERIDGALRSARITEQVSALMFIDLDNFKKLNDTQGHDRGDMLLIEVAERLDRCVRNADMVARLGGDEFIIILENLGCEETQVLSQIQKIAEKVITSVEKVFVLDGLSYHSGCSVGITLFNAYDRPEEIMKRADMAMYQAKEAGKNTYRFFDPDAEASLCSMAKMESDLRKALPLGQFELFYQPQCRGGDVFGAEALLRWFHPERGMVSPADFIPLAEDTGLIIPIGEWVISQACQQIERWQQSEEARHLSVSVNVSAKQFVQDNFVTNVKNCLNLFNIPSGKLELELTESLVLIDIEDTIEKMQQLRDLGVTFALDDFGTGYSSLLHLKKLPLDKIKIDRSFVQDIMLDPDDAEIVQTIILMAQNLGLNVIAEGVETEEQQTFLNAKGCECIQGYLMGKPSRVEQFEQLHCKGGSAVIV